MNSFFSVLENDPKSSITYNDIGVTYRELKDFTNAIKYHEKAVEIDPNFGQGYLSLGISYFENNVYDKAIPAFQKAIDLKYKPAKGYFYLGRIYQISDRCGGDAIYAYNKSIELDADYKVETKKYLSDCNEIMSYKFDVKDITIHNSDVGYIHILPNKDKIVYIASDEIYITDLNDQKTQKIAGPGIRSLMPSPDGEVIAYNQIDLNDNSIPLGFKNDVYLMNWDGSGKKRLTIDGHTALEKWDKDGREIYLSIGTGTNESDETDWEITGYQKITRDGDRLHEISYIPEENDIEISPMFNGDYVEYDILFKGKKIFSTIGDYSDTWKPQTIVLNNQDIIILEFKPDEGKKPPYYDGQCNLVLVNTQTPSDYKTIVSNIDCYPDLTISPDKKFISYNNYKEIWIRTNDFRFKDKLNINNIGDSPYIIWLQDSRSFLVIIGSNTHRKLHWIHIYENKN